MWLEAQGALEKWLKDFIYRLENAISVHPGRESRTVCLPLFPHLESARLQRPSSQELIIRWGKLLFQTADHAFALGNMAVVLAMHIASTQAFEDCLGPQHGATIEAMILTGQAYAHLAQYIEAEKFFHKAILHGTDEWTVLCAKAELVEVYQSQGRLVDAELQALDVIEKTTRLSGPEHAICLMSMERLAGVYQIQGRLKEADVLALEALALQTRSRLEAPDHADKALEYTSMACLGSIYQQAGNFLMAEQLCREAAYGLKEILGSDNPLTIEILYCLGEIWFKQGRMDDYELLINFLLPICTRVLSLKHPTTLHINIDKAFMYSCRGQLHETEELVENILLARQGVSGFDGSSTLLELKAILSQSYMRDDRFLEAEELATQCLREKKEIPGSDHPDTLIGTELLASMWNMQGRKADATNLLIYCLKSRLRVLPEDRDAIEKVRNLLRAWALDSGHESIDELLSPNGGQENPEDIFEDGLSLLFNFAM
ncbi:kinesin [Penicillium verhagenii]|uniref:kinesin n=1 Tax=Penicillium verhagenii TaxID=1562060 RepID=UPI00254543E3|nr:kinesin [Penicillium verhagenii]KAJ5936901.1 kinesin [Penicillium verhagenii]